MATQDEKIKTAANRATALTALAAGDQKSAGHCLASDEMAALVAGKLSSQEAQRCLDHLAACQSCYDEWRALAMDDMAAPGKIIKGPWFTDHSFSFAAAGSLLAAAACVLLYLNLSPKPVFESHAPAPMVMESQAPPEMSDDVQLRPPVEEFSVAPSVQTSSPPAPETAMELEAKKEKSVDKVSTEMAAPAPATSRGAAKPRKQKAMVAEQDGAVQEESVEAFAGLFIDGNEIMVDIGNVIPVVLKKMEQLSPGESLVLQTFKRDRSLTLSRLADDRVLIREEGFVQEEFEVDAAKLRKALRPLLKREFPRSNKVRISVSGQLE